MDELWNLAFPYCKPCLYGTLTIADGGKVVSMLNRIPVVAGSHIAQYIYGLATHPDYRGRGYAGKLLTEALESPEYSLAALMPERPSLIGFYERFGFTRRGSLPKDGRAVLIYSAEEIPEEVYIELAEKIKFFETEES